MRNHAKVSPQFWTGTTGKKLREFGPEAIVVAAYLMTGPSSNMIGLYYLPLPTLCHETGLSRQGALKALLRVSEANFAHYDETAEHVWIPEMLRFQVAEVRTKTDNRWKGIRNALDPYHKSPFYNDFVARYNNALDLELEFDNTMPAPSPLQAPCKPLRSQEKDKEKNKEKDKEKESTSCSELGKPPTSEPAVPPDLVGLKLYEADATLCKRWPELKEAWLEAYPRGWGWILWAVKIAHAWEIENPTHRKTDRPKYLGRWLRKEQDKPDTDRKYAQYAAAAQADKEQTERAKRALQRRPSSYGPSKDPQPVGEQLQKWLKDNKRLAKPKKHKRQAVETAGGKL